MRLLSFSHDRRSSWGALVGDRIVDLGAILGASAATLRAALAQMSVGEIERLAVEHAPTIPLAAVDHLPVVPNPGQIFCIGLNYDEHRRETGREPTGHPTVFLRTPASQVGHSQPLVRPLESSEFDYEGEIAIVIGEPGRRIAEAAAWDHIAGYAPYNDGSVRDWQRHATQWTPGKNFPATGAFGPWMSTRGEVADGQVLTLRTRVNGRTVQQATTDQLIFDIPRLIAYVSSFAALEPGDVIVTGTPGGVGARRDPPLFLRDGDTVDVEVEGVGTLTNVVQDG